jgi:hypothetical protein
MRGHGALIAPGCHYHPKTAGALEAGTAVSSVPATTSASCHVLDGLKGFLQHAKVDVSIST